MSRTDRQVACTGKKKYYSYKAADVAMRHLVRTRGDGDDMNVYRCRYCQDFHVGHLSRKYRK